MANSLPELNTEFRLNLNLKIRKKINVTFGNALMNDDDESMIKLKKTSFIFLANALENVSNFFFGNYFTSGNFFLLQHPRIWCRN